MVIERYQGLVAGIAYEFSRKFRMVDVDDIRQELWIWFLEHPNKVKTWEALDDEKHKQSVKLIARSLRNSAKDYCQKEKARLGGYRVEDNFYYDRALLEKLLPAVLRGDTTMPKLNDLGYTKSTQAASEGNNWFAMMADIEQGLKRLSEEQHNVIYLRFGDGCDNESLAGELSITEDAARMRVNRAVNNLMNYLGGKRPLRDKDYTEEQANAIGHGEIEPDLLEHSEETGRYDMD